MVSNRAWMGYDSIAARALSRKNDECICIYDDGHFVTRSEPAGCDNSQNYPSFNVAQTLGVEEGEGCNCC